MHRQISWTSTQKEHVTPHAMQISLSSAPLTTSKITCLSLDVANIYEKVFTTARQSKRATPLVAFKMWGAGVLKEHYYIVRLIQESYL